MVYASNRKVGITPILASFLETILILKAWSAVVRKN